MKAHAKHSLRLTLLTLGLVLSHPGWAARLALVIGNDSYQKVEPLKNARNDARLMAGVLSQAGFDVTQASDLNRESLWTTIDTFKGRISKGDEVVFYFAGHGVQIGANQLLLATDIPADNEAQVVRNGVPLIDVQDALKDARVAVLLLDACRDNPFPKTGTRTIGSTRGLSPPEPSTGQIIMMSAGRNQKALDRVPGEPQANGLFTWELSQVLKTPGVEIRTALEQVKERVDDKARKAGHEQRPSLVNDLRGNFYLLASVRPEPNPAYRPPVPGPAQGSGLSLDDLEREEATRKEWAQWQARMKADFDRTAAFKGSADLQAKAWERFLAAWSQDNPLSREDEGLRAQAQGRMQERQQEAQRLAAAAPAPAPVTPAPTAPTVTAQPAQPGQAFRDCTGEHCPELVVIPAGSFVMGSNDGDREKPPHSVSVRTFALGKYEVTQGQWKAVMGSNPSEFSYCGNNCPEENVSWNDIQQYLAKLNQMTGNRHGYRLASEAEWEYAARAGCSTAFNVGGQCKDKIEASEANFNGNYTYNGSAKGVYREKPIHVGSFRGNNWGLHDMHGNVSEWVQDCFEDNYSAGQPSDGSAHKGNDSICSRRVLRGGSWFGYPIDLRLAYRNRYSPGNRDFTVGFRIARTVP